MWVGLSPAVPNTMHTPTPPARLALGSVQIRGEVGQPSLGKRFPHFFYKELALCSPEKWFPCHWEAATCTWNRVLRHVQVVPPPEVYTTLPRRSELTKKVEVLQN